MLMKMLHRILFVLVRDGLALFCVLCAASRLLLRGVKLGQKDGGGKPKKSCDSRRRLLKPWMLKRRCWH